MNLARLIQRITNTDGWSRIADRKYCRRHRGGGAPTGALLRTPSEMPLRLEDRRVDVHTRDAMVPNLLRQYS